MLYTNQFNMPEAFVRVIDSLTRDLSEADPKRLGVTTLINPPRIRILTTRHWNEISEDYSDHIWRVLGNAIHYVLLNTENHQNLVEQKIEEIIDGITVVAKPDLYEDKDKSIQDWKVTSVWSLKFKDKDEWEKQLNPYAYFLTRAGFPVEKLFINAILKDWRRSEARKSKDYPRIPFQRIEIKLWSLEEQEKFIKDRIAEYKLALPLKDEELPLCSRKDRWAKDDEFKVKSKKRKIALRVCSSEKEANEFIKNLEEKKDIYIEKIDGQDIRCLDYCLCNKHCLYWQEKYGKNKENL